MASVRVKSDWPRTCQQNAATWTCLASSASGISAPRPRAGGAGRRGRSHRWCAGRGVDDEDLLDAVSEQLGQFAEQSLADEDGVVPAGVHIDACEAHSSVFLIVHRLLSGRPPGRCSVESLFRGRIQPSPHRCSAAKRLTGLNAVVSPPGLCSALQPQALCSALVMGAVVLGVGVFRVLFGTLETGEHIDDPIDHRRRR